MFTAQARKQLSAMCHKIQFLHKGTKINPQLNISNVVVLLVKRPRIFGSVVAHFQNGTYWSSACAGHNELE